ncbi:MAG: hypothetical protein R3B84_23990 [Zavarzinella sp.]
MEARTLLIGFDEADSAELASHLCTECIASEMLPKIVVQGEQL